MSANDLMLRTLRPLMIQRMDAGLCVDCAKPRKFGLYCGDCVTEWAKVAEREASDGAPVADAPKPDVAKIQEVVDEVYPGAAVEVDRARSCDEIVLYIYTGHVEDEDGTVRPMTEEEAFAF